MEAGLILADLGNPNPQIRKLKLSCRANRVCIWAVVVTKPLYSMMRMNGSWHFKAYCLGFRGWVEGTILGYDIGP